MKNYKLNEEEFVTMMCYWSRLRNDAQRNLLDAKYNQELCDYYQKEIDSLNAFADNINIKFKTNF